MDKSSGRFSARKSFHFCLFSPIKQSQSLGNLRLCPKGHLVDLTDKISTTLWQMIADWTVTRKGELDQLDPGSIFLQSHLRTYPLCLLMAGLPLNKIPGQRVHNLSALPVSAGTFSPLWKGLYSQMACNCQVFPTSVLQKPTFVVLVASLSSKSAYNLKDLKLCHSRCHRLKSHRCVLWRRILYRAD